MNDYEYISIEPGDRFTAGTSPDGELGILIRQTAFEQLDRWLTFGQSSDDLRRMEELIRALDELAKLTRRAV